MNKNTLYIMGNGFDIFHGIKSRYTDFGDYVEKLDYSLYEIFETYFSFEGNWSNLEDSLVHLDTDLIIDDASNFLVSYGAEKWSDSFHHDYQYEVEEIVKSLTTTLKKRFTDWVISLKIPDQSTYDGQLIDLNVAATFLTFNYTDTLQRLYKIPLNSILHIHNQAINSDSDLIFGHAVDPKRIEPLNSNVDLEDEDIRIIKANEIIDGYFSSTYKPTTDVITEHANFFNNLSNTEKIFVIGHSLSEVDIPYFKKITDNISKDKTNWVITYYDKADSPKFVKTMEILGISKTLVSFKQISSL